MVERRITQPTNYIYHVSCIKIKSKPISASIISMLAPFYFCFIATYINISHYNLNMIYIFVDVKQI